MATHREREIEVKVMCVIKHDGKLLLSEGRDEMTGELFYRFLSGSLEFGEALEDGVRREMREELQCEIENLTLLRVIESIFTFEGQKRHQLVFLYQCDLKNHDLYNQPTIHIVENTYAFDAKWIPIHEIKNGHVPLYPKYNYSELF